MYTHPVIDLHLFVKVDTLTYIFSRKITWARGCRKKTGFLFYVSQGLGDRHARTFTLFAFYSFTFMNRWKNLIERTLKKIILKGKFYSVGVIGVSYNLKIYIRKLFLIGLIRTEDYLIIFRTLQIFFVWFPIRFKFYY